MARTKRFPAGRCVHCLGFHEKLTSDHVLPSSYFPSSTSNTVERWQAPACKRCNEELGKIEERLLDKFGSVLDEDAPETQGIVQRILDSADPSRARNPKDAEMRKRKRERLRNQFKPLPASGPIFLANKTPGTEIVELDRSDLRRLAEKFTRGIVWVKLRSVIDDRYRLAIYVSPQPIDAFDNVAVRGDIFTLGPGFRVRWNRTVADPLNGVFLIELFGRFYFRTLVVSKDRPVNEVP